MFLKALSTNASGQGSLYFSKISCSKEPALTPILIEQSLFFETYELKQFSGSWKDDSYVDTIRVSLLTNNSNVCAPCIGPEDAPLKINFNCSSSLGWKNNQAVVLDADEDLSIVCVHVDTEGNRYTKTTIFSADSYSINHDIITSNPNEKMVF